MKQKTSTKAALEELLENEKKVVALAKLILKAAKKKLRQLPADSEEHRAFTEIIEVLPFRIGYGQGKIDRLQQILTLL